ncbi:RNA polymerase sigma factor [Bradymonadaceae bacterium TMQ3]|uniref:RNA polymerase sigma factor n=1 Tax=Lujinxingia sediminis TaxID=2480984 RepID=A0ABY0CVA0_9DELT|nr:RNA polymerase sigma factor [Lujinxingia sediminis]RDV36611.1 RNA polymerase sigma factor [Bradymonadaceae bacterium TMQ3]RVU46996.1 RNA polymerase sigma factor [Lujinxingia sediminis]TXC68607.1 RNA polymerase sigma factor [Bradymonadales bacterium TMQ1]
MLFAVIKSLLGRRASGAATEPRLDELSDEALMTRYAGGDQKAFTLLVTRHQGPLYNFILRSCRQPSLADELLQETFLRIVKSAASYSPDAKFTTWAYTIARNLCIDLARKHSRAHTLSLQKPLGDDEGATRQDILPDEQARSASVDHDRMVFRDRLDRALANLPEDQREVFILREISGLKFREIATMLDCPVPTIKSRMRYALQTLRGELADFASQSFDADEASEMLP